MLPAGAQAHNTLVGGCCADFCSWVRASRPGPHLHLHPARLDDTATLPSSLLSSRQRLRRSRLGSSREATQLTRPTTWWCGSCCTTCRIRHRPDASFWWWGGGVRAILDADSALTRVSVECGRGSLEYDA
jgi:hypothetical protein